MTFSLLMPTLCRPFLKDAIAAVQAQTYTHWELLISPGCGVVSDDPRIRAFDRLSPNTPDTLNHMVSVSTGDVFAVAADDDLLDPLALSAVATYMKAHPWLVGRINRGGSAMGSPCDFRGLMDANLIPLPSAFWTRGAATATGLFDPAHHLCFDYDYWIRMWKAVGPPRFIDYVLSDYRDHPEQATHLMAEAVREDAAAVRRKHARSLSE